MKKSKGITLVVFVITVIILLILVGISLAMLTGDNSILKKATNHNTNDVAEVANGVLYANPCDGKNANFIGVRPIVSPKSGVQLEKKSEGVYSIK